MNDNKKYFYIGLVVLIVSILLQHQFKVDWWVQGLFFNFESKNWVFQGTSPEVKLLFYTMPKVVLILGSLTLLFINYRKNGYLWTKENSLFLFCIIFIPASIGYLKQTTNIHCPYDLVYFDGKVPFRSLFDFNSYSLFFNSFSNGNCFPGGHASGGFAFLASIFVLPSKYKKIGIIISLIIGTYMGVYQMLRGAHFLSHILFTFGFSLVVVGGLHYAYLKKWF